MTTIDKSVSLVIATYNSPDFLRLCLESAFKQTILPREILIADDGSTNETIELIAVYKQKSPVPIIHLWQEDKGFRAAKIRNIAIAAAQAEYIVQIDGDIIMEKHFIEDHLFHRKENTLLQGSRVLVNPKKTNQLTKGLNTTLSFWSKGVKRRENGFRSKRISSYLSTRYRNRYPIYYARGCNMSFYKADFMKVNGYNHDFIGWGHEDSELTLRMLNAGCQKHYIKFHCAAYHLYHKERSKQQEQANREKMDQQVLLNATWCDNGVDQFIDTYQQYVYKQD